MNAYSASKRQAALPGPSAVLALLKPITWFPPMWAYACGAVSVGAIGPERWPYILGGIVLAGPLICGGSQAINDWFDRHVDAINEPDRVIPSGRMPGRWGLYIAILWTVLSLAVAALLGPWVLVAAIIGLILAWAYSMPPFRLKLNGWWGNGAVGFSYESLPWMTAAAAALGTLPPGPILIVALLYGIGAHGIMTLNDFKAIDGDRIMGVATLPVQLGAKRAALVACLVMAAPQAVVIALLLAWSMPVHAGLVAALLFVQIACMTRFVREPRRLAVWYSAIGVGLYVTGMMITAFALRAITTAPV
ncbi:MULTISPECIES: chlorophyll synthase ChlG [unclassified Roseitalea]|uniref:chlorophyll synthase ChlG n=1 Tax=unclassified Roseitalea TaxID=2639107 RepID=UPI0027401DC9|nr:MULTISPECIES: chlorophyll synthase ChlG [unclassified Roseitalea]